MEFLEDEVLTFVLYTYGVFNFQLSISYVLKYHLQYEITCDLVPINRLTV